MDGQKKLRQLTLFGTGLSDIYSHLHRPVVTGIDRNLPSLANKNNYVCKRGCRFVLRSEASAARHEILFHLEEKRNDQRRLREAASGTGQNTKQHVCKHKLEVGTACGFVANSAYYLRKHKNSSGHKR